MRYLSPLFPPELIRHSQLSSKLLNVCVLIRSPPPTRGNRCKQPSSAFHFLLGKSGCPKPRHWLVSWPSNNKRHPASFSPWVSAVAEGGRSAFWASSKNAPGSSQIRNRLVAISIWPRR